MLHYTKYAIEKFDLLHGYRCYLTKEMVEDAIANPDKSGTKAKYLYAQKDRLKVLFKRENGIVKIYTFFPVKK